MASENEVLRRIWLKLGVVCRLFRVNTGQAYVTGGGKPITLRGGDSGVISVGGKTARLSPGTVIIPNGRPISMGFTKPDGRTVVGTLDLNGFTSIIITPEMVGQKVAVFTCVDAKRSKGGRVSPEQQKMIDFVELFGGIGGIAASEDEALQIIERWVEKRHVLLSTSPQ